MKSKSLPINGVGTNLLSLSVPEFRFFIPSGEKVFERVDVSSTPNSEVTPIPILTT